MATCLHCKKSRFTEQNVGRMYRTPVPGGYVHLTCLPTWSHEYLLTNLFPGATESERQVMRYRLGLGTPGTFLTEDEIGAKVQRSANWVSQQQRKALDRLKRKTSQERNSKATQREEDEALQAIYEAAKGVVAALEPRFDDPFSLNDFLRSEPA